MNPYEILGIPPNATEAEIKRAYKTLIKKYHPDVNANNPNREAYEEKFKEVQQAYDMLMKKDRRNPNQFWDAYNSSSTGAEETNLHFQAARSYIQNGRLDEAMNVLNSMDEGRGNAEWYFLRSNVFLRMGREHEAVDDARMAASMEPNNMTYCQYLFSLESGPDWYAQTGTQYGRPNMSCSLSPCLLCPACLACGSGGWFCFPFCI